MAENWFLTTNNKIRVLLFIHSRNITFIYYMRTFLMVIFIRILAVVNLLEKKNGAHKAVVKKLIVSQAKLFQN